MRPSLRLRFLAEEADIRVGDRFLTSGHGGVFPPDIPVARVSNIDADIISLEPLGLLEKLNYVRVMDYQAVPDEVELLEAEQGNEIKCVLRWLPVALPGLLPVVSAFFLAILMLVPIGTGAANVVVPHLVLIAVFYWLSSRPLLMPYGACAILGFWLDLWLEVPLGLNMLVLLLTRLFVLNQLKHYRGRE